MKIISRQEAIDNKLTRYFTGEPCKHGHIAEKLLSNRTCVKCSLIKKRIRGQRPDVKESNLARLKQKDIDNPAGRLARTRKRQAAKLNRTPPWLSPTQLDEIEDFYTIAKMFQMYSGDLYHVDHIEPLQGKDRSGLHVPWNLQVIPYKENLKKSNKASF